jgi:multiple sugar transport system permease protein
MGLGVRRRRRCSACCSSRPAPILATLAISLTHWDLLTAPEPAGVDNYTKLFDDPRFLIAVRNTAFYTIVSVPLGMLISLGPRASPSTRRSPESRDPDDVLPADRDLDDRDRPRLVVDLQTVERPAEPVIGIFGPAAQRWDRGPFWAMPAIIGCRSAGPAGQHDHLPRLGLQAIPVVLLRRRERRRGGRWARTSAT